MRARSSPIASKRTRALPPRPMAPRPASAVPWKLGQQPAELDRQPGSSVSRSSRSSSTWPVRSASTHGAKGRIRSVSQHRPISPAAALSGVRRQLGHQASLADADLADRIMRLPRPAMARSSASSRRARSRSRPISGAPRRRRLRSDRPGRPRATATLRLAGLPGRRDAAGAAAQDVLVKGLRLGLARRSPAGTLPHRVDTGGAPPRAARSRRKVASAPGERTPAAAPAPAAAARSGRRPRSPPPPAGKPATVRGLRGPAPRRSRSPRPVLERRLGIAKLKEIALIQREGVRERGRGCRRYPLQKPRDIHAHPMRVRATESASMRSGGGSAPRTLFRSA